MYDQDTRSHRRRERYARPCLRIDRDFTIGMPGADVERAGRNSGQTATDDAEHAGFGL